MIPLFPFDNLQERWQWPGAPGCAIERLNEDRSRMPSQGYRDAVGNMYGYAGQARDLVSVHLEYAQACEKLNRLDVAVLQPGLGDSRQSRRGNLPCRRTGVRCARRRNETLR